MISPEFKTLHNSAAGIQTSPANLRATLKDLEALAVQPRVCSRGNGSPERGDSPRTKVNGLSHSARRPRTGEWGRPQQSSSPLQLARTGLLRAAGLPLEQLLEVPAGPARLVGGDILRRADRDDLAAAV